MTCSVWESNSGWQSVSVVLSFVLLLHKMITLTRILWHFWKSEGLFITPNHRGHDEQSTHVQEAPHWGMCEKNWLQLGGQRSPINTLTVGCSKEQKASQSGVGSVFSINKIQERNDETRGKEVNIHFLLGEGNGGKFWLWRTASGSVWAWVIISRMSSSKKET